MYSRRWRTNKLMWMALMGSILTLTKRVSTSSILGHPVVLERVQRGPDEHALTEGERRVEQVVLAFRSRRKGQREYEEVEIQNG
jgi:hypothetical protein